VAAIFVANREPVQEILDRAKTDVLEVGSAPGTDALQELERSA